MLRVVRGDAAPRERLLVLLDLDTVQFDRPHDRFVRYGDEALLPRRAQHQHVGINGVAHQSGRHLVRIEQGEVRFADDVADRVDAVRGTQAGVAMPDEIAGRHLGGIQDRARVSRAVGLRGLRR